MTTNTGEVPARRAVAFPEASKPFDGFAAFTGHDLSPDELRELASTLAAHEEIWAADVAYSDDERHFVSVYRDSHIDVWLLCWTPANDTGWHDHDISSGAVAVARGELTEHNLAVGSDGLITSVPAGHAFSFGPEHIHRLTGSAAGAVSIHAYSPPLWRMGQYAISEQGVLRRVSVSYADELRPIT